MQFSSGQRAFGILSSNNSGRIKIVVALLTTLNACGIFGDKSDDDNGPLMRPGENCNSCHSFAIAGTAFPALASDNSAGVADTVITITDSVGKTFSLTSNSAGNFFGGASVQFPVTATATHNGKVSTMTTKVSDGSCSTCHTQAGASGAPGRVTGEAVP